MYYCPYEIIMLKFKVIKIISFKRIDCIMNNYAKSAPEAVLHYYICKYVDKNATLNFIQLTEDGITYTADITCTFQDRLYDIEFDSLSYHSSEIEIDVSNNAIKTMLTYIIGKNTANISIERDYNYILDHYFPNSNLKRIEIYLAINQL